MNLVFILSGLIMPVLFIKNCHLLALRMQVQMPFAENNMLQYQQIVSAVDLSKSAILPCAR
jgi:hypothetical protein